MNSVTGRTGNNLHTPGPWRIIPHPSEGTKCAAIASAKALEYADGHATVWSDYSGANARLIAAAPALLEALVELRTCNEAEEGEPQDFAGAMDRAAAAIALATGDQP